MAYSGVQDQAKAAAVEHGFRQIDKSFTLYATSQNITTWWLDNDPALTGSANPHLSDIIADTGLKNYLSQEPPIPGYPSAYWWYDNDGDTYDPTGCTSSTAGVNIVLANIDQKLAQQVDKTLDDGNLSCGQVRYNTTSGDRIFFSLSDDQTL